MSMRITVYTALSHGFQCAEMSHRKSLTLLHVGTRLDDSQRAAPVCSHTCLSPLVYPKYSVCHLGLTR